MRHDMILIDEQANLSNVLFDRWPATYSFRDFRDCDDTFIKLYTFIKLLSWLHINLYHCIE